MSKQSFILIAIAALTACSSDKTLEEVKDITLPDSPMQFSTHAEGEQNVTRGSLLTQGFQVSCWKNFGAADQQTVMNDYNVLYHPGAAQTWTYDDVEGQYLRYWDLSAYPYHFHAVTPYLQHGSASITPGLLSINLSATEAIPFRAQTFLEETYNQDVANSEPCMVAHVSRSAKNANGEYIDHDHLATAAENYTINTTNQTNAVREVHLPFHHLMSKVGFRFYIDYPEEPSYDIYLSNVSISIFNAKDKFVLESQQYTAAATPTTDLMHGTFGDLIKTTTDEQPLITKEGQYPAVNMKEHLNKEHAFDFYCPDDMLQIPQKDLVIRVRLTLKYNFQGEDKQVDYDSLLRLDPEDPASAPQHFDWDPSCHYIYYLHLRNLEDYPIVVCTAELVPWEIVQTEDIPIGL